MLCGWEGNRRSGVALAMRHRLQRLIQLRAHGLGREMSTPPTLCCGVRPPFTLPVRTKSLRRKQLTRVVLPTLTAYVAASEKHRPGVCLSVSRWENPQQKTGTLLAWT